jgi:hypothetical protein
MIDGSGPLCGSWWRRASSCATPSWRPGRGLVGGREKQGLQAAFAAEVVAETDALVGLGPVDAWDLEASEAAARWKALRVAAGARRAPAQRQRHGLCGSDAGVRVRATGALRGAARQDR